MVSNANVRVVRFMPLVFLVLLAAAPVQTRGQVCGNVNADGSGMVNIGDITYLVAYLFIAGDPPPYPRDANTDGIGNLTNNDVVALVNYIYVEMNPISCADTVSNTLFPQSSDTVEFRELLVPPGNTTWDIEVWIKATDPYHGLSLPFTFECPTSPLTLQTIYIPPGVGSGYYESGAGDGIIGMMQIGAAIPAGEFQIATLTFSINSSASEQIINMGALLNYPPSNTLVLSRIGGGVSGYSPVVAMIGPSFTEVELEPADVVSIVTADLDLDNYTDVIYAGDTEVGLFVSWGQDADPPIAPGLKFLDVTDASIDVFHMNADTLPDIVAVTSASIYTLINNGNRTFTTHTTPNSSSAYRQPGRVAASFGTAPQFAIGFVDGDQYPDLVVSPNKWFAGDGSGGFSSNPAFGFSYVSVAISDFNADGYDDLVVIESDSAVIYGNDNVSPGTFSKAGGLQLGLTSYDLSSITTSIDVNLDGVVDVVAVVAENTGGADESFVTVALGDGAGNLTLADVMTIAGTAPQVSLSDVDRDYNQDVVVSNASDGNLEIHYNDGAGQFGNVELVDIATSDDLMFALTTADLDRDGQPDFISGSAAGENLTVVVNNGQDEAILADEMFVTGYNNVQLHVTNPSGFIISRSLQTVAGSDYYRLLVDANSQIDARTYDYNLMAGEYTITTSRIPGTLRESIVVGIGINGSQQRVVANDYDWPPELKSAPEDFDDPFVFYYDIDVASVIFPKNGLPTTRQQPTFDWSVLVGDDPPGTEYLFQMCQYHDFVSSPLIHDVPGLTSPQFTPPTPLEVDSIYYWRYAKSSGGPYEEHSRAFAAYIVYGCCEGRVGDVNGLGGDEPTIGDISVMIDAKFITGSCDGILYCLAEADVNQSGETNPTCDDITIGDISYLVDYLFITGPSLGLAECL